MKFANRIIESFMSCGAFIFSDGITSSCSAGYTCGYSGEGKRHKGASRCAQGVLRHMAEGGAAAEEVQLGCVDTSGMWWVLAGAAGCGGGCGGSLARETGQSQLTGGTLAP